MFKLWMSALLGHSSLGQMPVIQTITLFRSAKHTHGLFLFRGFIQVFSVLTTLLFFFPVIGSAQVAPSAKEREPLGSLTSIGEVFVNDSPAPAEVTIFAGDRVRTGETGSATFNMSGKGSLKMWPRSEVVFSGKYEYAAEFETGAAVMSSVSGPNGFTLRIGNEVVVPSIKEHTATASIQKSPDGTLVVKCLDGAMGVLALQGSSGEFIQVGQSVGVASNGSLSALVEPNGSLVRTKSSSGAHGPIHSAVDWTYIGLGVAGATGTALALSHGGGKQSISPSAP